MPLIPIYLSAEVFGAYAIVEQEWLDYEDEKQAPYFQFVFAPRIFPEDPEAIQQPTKLDVFNIAALALGFLEGVGDPDENSEVAALLRRRWTNARRSFFEEHTYNGIKRTQVLTKKDTAPVGGRWELMYTLPEDCLRVITINGWRQHDGTDPWEVEVDCDSGERVIMTNAANCKAAMLVDPPSISHLKPKVIEALGLYLAHQCAPFFPMSDARLDTLRRKLRHATAMAKGTDAQEGTPPQRSPSENVRQRGIRR